MHTYRHKKNGSSFSTPCVCTGEDWEEVKPSGSAKSGKKKTAETESAADGGEES